MPALVALAVWLPVAAACGTGDLGPILGPDAGDDPSGQADRQIVGEIESTDHARREFVVDDRGRDVRVVYERDTRVLFRSAARPTSPAGSSPATPCASTFATTAGCG